MPKVIEPDDHKYDISHERLIHEIEHASISRLPDTLLHVLNCCVAKDVFTDIEKTCLRIIVGAKLKAGKLTKGLNDRTDNEPT